MIYVATLPDRWRYYAARQLTCHELALEACEAHGVHGSFAVCTARLVVRKGMLVEQGMGTVLVDRRKPPETYGERLTRLYREHGLNKVMGGKEAVGKEFLDRLEAWLKAGGG